MKQFLKMTLAVIFGLILMSFIGIFLISGFFSALSAGGSGSVPIPREGVLTLDMSKLIITEQTRDEMPGIDVLMSSGLEEMPKCLGLRQAVQAINYAASDPAVKFIYILPDGNTTGLAQLQEIRTALSNFRQSGKAVIAYTTSPSTGSYYLASVADKIYMTSCKGATCNLSGISGRLIFLKDLLDKFGINMQLIRHGKYKSAGEMYVRSSASPENMEQNQSMVNSMWSVICSEIAQSRQLKESDINDAIDNLRLCEPEDFEAYGFVDELLDMQGLNGKLMALAGKDSYKAVNFITLHDYANAKVVPNFKAKDKIAVIFADGEIIDGDGKQEVAGDRFARIISKVREDADIKAVVLRVNSPGGSVLASEKIKNELDLLKGSKPLVASYGAYAASGGYWISNNCDRIFSDAVTLTGSIGVFSMIPDASKAVKDIAHVNVTPINSNKHGDMYNFTRPLDKDEYDYMLRSVESIYDKFIITVAEGRGMETDFVDGIGQGRVWTGIQGIDNGLVDQIGTLEDAISYAAEAAGNPDITGWNVVEYPKPLTTMEMIMESISGVENPDEIHAAYNYWKKFSERCRTSTVMARMDYDIAIL